MFAKLLGRFQDNGHDVTEDDRLHMLSIFNMAQEAQKLGILKSRDNKAFPSYDLYYKLMRHIDFSAEQNRFWRHYRVRELHHFDQK